MHCILLILVSWIFHWLLLPASTVFCPRPALLWMPVFCFIWTPLMSLVCTKEDKVEKSENPKHQHKQANAVALVSSTTTLRCLLLKFHSLLHTCHCFLYSANLNVLFPQHWYFHCLDFIYRNIKWEFDRAGFPTFIEGAFIKTWAQPVLWEI